MLQESIFKQSHTLLFRILAGMARGCAAHAFAVLAKSFAHAMSGSGMHPMWRVHPHFRYEHFNHSTLRQTQNDTFFEQVLSGGPKPSGTIIVRKWAAMAAQLGYVGVGSTI